MQPDPNELLEQIAHLQGVATKLGKLVGSQQEAIQQNELDTLEFILQQKQRLIDQLQDYGKLRTTCLQDQQLVNDKKYSKLASAVEQLEKTIRDISLAEQSIINLIQERHLEMGRQLRLLTQTRQASTSYAQTSPGQPKRRIDISG